MKSKSGNVRGSYNFQIKDLIDAVQSEDSPYRALMELSPDAIVLSDKDGIILLANRQTAVLHGYKSEQELIGKHAIEFFPQEVRKLAIDQLNMGMKAAPGESLKFEIALQKKDGTRFWGELIGKRMVFPECNIPLMLTIVRDITERRKADDALKKSERKYRILVDHANELIVVAQDGFLKYANQTAIDSTGYSLSELTSRPFSDLIHPDDRDKVVENYKKRIAGELIPSRYAFRVLQKSGKFRWCEISAGLIDWEGRPATLNLLTDVTDRIAAEEAIRASLREKEVMLQEIHHRVKNNFQVILSLFRLHSNQVHNPEYLDLLRKGQSRIKAMSLVHEKAYQSNDFSKIDMLLYIESLISYLLHIHLVDDEQIHINLNCKDVYLDINSAIPLGLLLNELITNSLKHAFSNGRKGIISIRLEVTPENKYFLRVTDNGVGFPANFDFIQAESLGLQIVKLLVDQLDGSIDFHQIGGPIFTITFNKRKRE